MNGEVPYLNAKEDIAQRAATILSDVHYVIEAHFEMTSNAGREDNEGKFKDIFRRRLKNGRAYMQPYFGCREFPAFFAEWKDEDIPAVDITKDLGLMLYDLDYTDPGNIQPMYFHAKLEHGVMQVSGEKVLK